MELDYAAAEQAGWLDEASQPRGQISVPEKEVSLLRYAPALLVALFKDLLDLIIGWIPLIGAVFAMGLGFLIGMLLMKARMNYRFLKDQSMLSLLPKLGGATLVESLPLIDILPVQTAMVYAVYLSDKRLEAKYIQAFKERMSKRPSRKAVFEA